MIGGTFILLAGLFFGWVACRASKGTISPWSALKPVDREQLTDDAAFLSGMFSLVGTALIAYSILS